MSETQEQVLNRLLAGLQSEDEQLRLAALHELGTLDYSSPAILQHIERIALHDPAHGVRAIARDALNSQTLRFIRSRLSSLPGDVRRIIMAEIDSWKEARLIQAEQAEVIEHRYNYDLAPTPSESSPQKRSTVSTQVPTPPTPAVPAEPPAPRPSLTQTLLSETSIKIALYLGAFMVVAAGATLAALVEAVRLPILAAVTLGFGVAAAATRKRLPQPSFVLFIVFSCLLPFDSAVLSDMLALNPVLDQLFWAITYTLLAGIWVAATWFYVSRFFSVAAFVGIEISLFHLLTSFDLQPGIDLTIEFYLICYILVGFIGLVGVFFLKRWKDKIFALPLFGLTLLHTLILAFILVGVGAARTFDQSAPTETWSVHWLLAALTWLGISVFFVIANSLYPSALFPWAVTLFILPIPWTFLQAFDGLPGIIFVIVIWTLGALYAFGSEAVKLSSMEKVRQYDWPLRILSYLPIMAAWIWGASENVSYGFGVALGTTLVFGILTARKVRVLPWTSLLVAALTTYFTFFQLPFMEPFSISVEYLIATASLLLLIPDLFLPPDLNLNKTLRWPPRILGAALVFPTLGYLANEDYLSAGHRAIVLSLFALLALGYALRYQKEWAVYVFSLLMPFVVLEALDQFNSPLWLPALTALAVAYYAAGTLVKNIPAVPLRYSALALGGLVVIAGLFDNGGKNSGWYSLIMAALFAVEQYRHKKSWMEAGIFVFASAAWWKILEQFGVREAGYFWIGLSVIWIFLDLGITFSYHETRRLKDLARIGAALISTWTAVYLIGTGIESPRVAAIGFNVLTAAILGNALLRRSPRLGYFAAAASALAVFFALRDFGQSKWLFPLIGLAISYYMIGFILRIRKARTSEASLLAGWDVVFLNSGLGLGSLVSLSAPLQGGLDAAIPVALAATLWTIEAFIQRNVWLGFPSNGLYLMAYFMILSTLNVAEPQFYSVGAAALGLLMHYLLTRSGSRTGAFLTGLVSQFVLLSTTYIQMVSSEQLIFFAVLFFQGLAVLVYGIIIRSRSLVITPIVFVVLGVITVVYSALKGISTVILIGCTGVVLLMLGILAVVLRERLTKMSGRFGDWRA